MSEDDQMLLLMTYAGRVEGDWCNPLACVATASQHSHTGRKHPLNVH
jgi:hypothetical protein